MSFDGFLKKQLHYSALAIVGFCVVAMTAGSAEAAGGSWGSSLGGFSSRGGMGCGGGLLGGRAPVRNLLGRLNSRVSNLGGGSRGGLLSGGSNGGSLGGSTGGSLGGGSFGGGSRGGLLGGGLLSGGLLGGRIFNGSRGGLLGIRNGGSQGGYYGGSTGSYSSLGSSIAPSYPVYVAAAPVETTYAMPSYDYSSFSASSPTSNYVMEQSYPVGDYGFEPGYPIQQYSTPMGLGYPMQSDLMSSGFPSSGFPTDGTIVEGSGFSFEDSLGTSPITDGGSIDSMLDGSGMPLNSGLELNVPTPAGGEYYDGLGPGDGSTPPTGDSGLPGPAGDDGTFIQRSNDTKAVLNLILPKEAKVLINGKETATRGGRRSYVSRRLLSSRDYKYQVKAIVMRNGKESVRTKMVTMRPGVDQTVRLDFDDTVTTLALRVPADAKVKLCGKTTQQTGTFRSYTTDSLPDGETWKSYKVSVEYVVDGKKRVEERTLDLAAGEQHELAIGIDPTDSQVAAK